MLLPQDRRAGAAGRSIPTCWRPTYTGSPCSPVSLPSSRNPTSIRCGCAWPARSSAAATDEVFVAPKVHGEPDARFERVDLVVVLVAHRDQPGFDPQDVERVQAQRRETLIATRFPDRLPHGDGIAWMAEDLVAQLARVARARHHDRHALRLADPTHQEPEPPEFVDRRLGRGRPDEPSEDLPAVRPLDRDVVQLVDRRLSRAPWPSPSRSACSRSQMPTAVVAHHEPEVVLAQPEHRALVDHAALVVAHGRVDDLSRRQPAGVTRDRGLRQRLRVGSQAPRTFAAATDP